MLIADISHNRHNLQKVLAFWANFDHIAANLRTCWRSFYRPKYSVVVYQNWQISGMFVCLYLCLSVSLYIDDLRIDDWSSILRWWILSISIIHIDDPNISQSYNIEVPVWITSRLPTPIIHYFCAYYWCWLLIVDCNVLRSQNACLIKCPFEVVRKILTNQMFDNFF